VRARVKEVAEKMRRWGYRQIHSRLRIEKMKVNHKRVYRIYCEEKLVLRSKRRRKRKGESRVAPLPPASRPNERWAMDFVSDSLVGGRKLRIPMNPDTRSDFNRTPVPIFSGHRFRF
jgi:putative transposase